MSGGGLRRLSGPALQPLLVVLLASALHAQQQCSEWNLLWADEFDGPLQVSCCVRREREGWQSLQAATRAGKGVCHCVVQQLLRVVSPCHDDTPSCCLLQLSNWEVQTGNGCQVGGQGRGGRLVGRRSVAAKPLG